MRRGDFDDLYLFSTVARERSFTRTAAKVGLSPSAVSHAMRALEERLGVRLLQRTTRSVAPTGAGERLLASLGPALAEIGEGLAALDAWRSMPSGTLRITTFAQAAETILVPRLPGFLLANPAVSVEVDIDNALTDIVSAGFDAGIRFGDSIERDMIAVRVGPDLRTIVVGTPAYFRDHPVPEHPNDLERHRCIGYRLKSIGGLLPWWFERDGQEIEVRVAGPLVDTDGRLALAATRAGAGLGYVQEQDVAAEIGDGRLVQVLADWCPPFQGCFLYHPSRRQVSPALRALIEALRWREPSSPAIQAVST